MSDELDRELEQLLRDGSVRRPNRRLRLAIIAVVFLVLVAVFLTLARLSRPPRKSASASCTATLVFRGSTYEARTIPAGALTQSEAIGVGTTPACGSNPKAQYDVRSLVAVPTSLAVALPGPNDAVFVARGHCRGVAQERLVRCLRRGG